MTTDSTPDIIAEPVAAPKRKVGGLGRGLNALLGESRREEPLVRSAAGSPGGGEASGTASGQPNMVAMIGIAAITPHPDQPRRHFDDAALDELAASIASRGVIQPVIVRPMASGRYQLVAGERRWRAAQRARLHEIPAIVRDLDERDTMVLALIENIQREDLNPVEEARAYQRLMDDGGLSHQDLARMVDKSRSHVANLLRLLGLPAGVLDMVADGRISMGHARALINAPESEVLANQVVAGNLSVRDTEKLVQNLRNPDAAKPRKAAQTASGAKDADIAAVERHLEDLLGLKVVIQPDADPRSGAISVRYGNLDQLDMLCQRLSGGLI